MTSGWDAVRRVQLAAPWDANWVDVYVDPPMGVYIDMRKALTLAVARPDEESITALIRAMRPLVAAHNLVDRGGAPLEDWGTGVMGARLIRAISAAIQEVQNEEEGAPADPLPSNPTSSRASASRGRRSTRTTPSGVLPHG